MPNPARLAAAMALVCGTFLTTVSHADDPRVDPETGREMANYAPPRHFDHLHMRLELDIPDMNEQAFTAVETLRITPVGKSRQALVFDAGNDLEIESVRIGATEQGFVHADRRLTISFHEPVALGRSVDVEIRYSGTAKRANGAGLTWTKGRPRGSETDCAAQIHSQGQPPSNHTWFPCHDFPNERMTTEVIVTVEDGFVVGSNGRLLRTSLGTPAASGRPRTRWHWMQDKPHASYLVSLVVGRFSIVGLPEDPDVRGPRGAGVPCWLYAPVGDERAAQMTYSKTSAMLAAFERVFDEPYPWDKYSQALVRRFAAGGMENTSATTMPDSSADAGDGWDDVIAHEAGHQWTGDLLTCKSWEHVWLNEGWASYCEALWAEAAAAKGKKREYQRKVASFVTRQRMMNATYAPDYPGMVSRRWSNPLEPFMRPNDAYAKGAIVLHMLRQELGDEVFFRGVRSYIDRFRLREVETDDFRQVLEEASGRDLERFFAQWCDRPGLPRLDIELEWIEPAPGEAGSPTQSGGELVISVKQTQRIDRDNPAYALRLPVVIKSGEPGTPAFSSSTEYLWVDMRESTHRLSLAEKPTDVVVDPNMNIAAPTRIRKPLAMLLEQLRDDTEETGTVFAQLQAVEMLAERPGTAAVLLVLGLDGSRDPLVRRAATEAVLKGPARGTVAAITGSLGEWRNAR
jgi:aminopeptidase N